jgi:hypothetical protein
MRQMHSRRHATGLLVWRLALVMRMGYGSGSMARLADRCATRSATQGADRVASGWDVWLVTCFLVSCHPRLVAVAGDFGRVVPP